MRSLSRQKTIRSLSRQRILCRDRTHLSRIPWPCVRPGRVATCPTLACLALSCVARLATTFATEKSMSRQNNGEKFSAIENFPTRVIFILKAI